MNLRHAAIYAGLVSACAGAFFAAKAADRKSSAPELRPMQFSIQFIGMHTLSPTRHWPQVPFGSVRPAGASWGAMEPEKGQFDWHSLDSWVAQSESHHVQLDYVFVNTPRWASSKPDEPCPGHRMGCAAPPNPDDFAGFVTALVTRYRGKISSYELWNEPNGSGFWSGTPKQMAELAARAYPIIKSIDPAAIVTSPAVSSSGWPLAHDAWLDQYLAAGGGKFADVIAWHGYAGRNDRPALPPEGLSEQIAALRSVLAKHNASQLPIWNTEGGWGKDAQLPDENAQAAFLVKWFMINFTNRIARAYWYQWDNPEWGTLWREGTGMTAAGHAAQQVADWLDGTTAAVPCAPVHGSELWECELQKGGKLYRVAWSASGETPLPDVNNIVALTPLGEARQQSKPKQIVVTSQPILIEYGASK